MKRTFAVALALSLVASALLTATFMPATLPLEPLPPFQAPLAHPPESMKLLALPAGSMKASAAFSFRGGRFEDERSFAMGGILVLHPGGNLLFDTGFGRNIDQHAQARPLPMRVTTRYTKGIPVVDQLKKLGLDPRTLKGVVLTHTHWDHVSGLDDLRQTPVLLPRSELDFVRSGDRAAELLHSFGSLNYQPYDFSDGPYLGFERSRDVFGDGSVVLVEAGGHTPGSVIGFISLPEGTRYALIGDLVWQMEGIDLPTERPWLLRKLVDEDEARVRTVIVRMHMLKKRYPKLVIVPAHDARVWATLPTVVRR